MMCYPVVIYYMEYQRLYEMINEKRTVMSIASIFNSCLCRL